MGWSVIVIVFAKSAESNYQFKEKEEKEEERVSRSIASFGISVKSRLFGEKSENTLSIDRELSVK